MIFTEFLQSFKQLEALYGEASKAKQEVYYSVLKCLSTDELNIAISKTIAERVYPTMPMPAELLQAAKGTMDEQAQRALDLALDACITAGGCSVIFQDQKLNRVIKLFGGWNAFGYMSFTGGEVEAQANRKRFIEYYKSAEPLKISHFIGEYEKNNKMDGVLDKNTSFVYKVANSGKITKVSLNEREKEFELLENKASAGALSNIKAIANIKKIS